MDKCEIYRVACQAASIGDRYRKVRDLGDTLHHVANSVDLDTIIHQFELGEQCARYILETVSPVGEKPCSP